MNLEQLQFYLAGPPNRLGVLKEFWTVRPRFNLCWQPQLDSTNRGLWELVRAGSPSGTVLLATTQSAGRGQWGRQWQSPAGGVYLSLGLKPEIPVAGAPFLTLATAWGLVTSLRNLSVPAQVKWPNDVVVNGKKLGGILSETRVEGGVIQDVVIGLGVNGFNPVPSTGISIQQVFQPDFPPPPLNTVEGVAAVALYGLIQGYLYWQNYGNQALLNAYQTFMSNLGQTIVFDNNLVEIIGVSTSGNLQVKPCLDTRKFARTREIEPGKVTLGYNA